MNIIFFILLNNNLNPLANTRSLTDLKKNDLENKTGTNTK